MTLKNSIFYRRCLYEHLLKQVLFLLNIVVCNRPFNYYFVLNL